MPKQTESKIEIQAKTGLTLLYTFIILFVVNVLVVYLANQLFPTDVVLGTYSLSPWWSLHHSMTKLTFIVTFIVPFVYYYEWKRGSDFTTREWMLLYFVVNTGAIWVITRFAEVFGLGISHWWVAVLLATALDWAQGMAMIAVGKAQGR